MSIGFVSWLNGIYLIKNNYIIMTENERMSDVLWEWKVKTNRIYSIDMVLLEISISLPLNSKYY